VLISSVTGVSAQTVCDDRPTLPMTKSAAYRGHSVWRDRVALSILITRNTNSEPSHGLDRQGGGCRIGQHQVRHRQRGRHPLRQLPVGGLSVERRTPSWPSADRRKTKTFIPIGALFYEVGPEVTLAADTFRAKQLHDEYTESPEYMALLRGALA
jgi:hypothetical protein